MFTDADRALLQQLTQRRTVLIRATGNDAVYVYNEDAGQLVHVTPSAFAILTQAGVEVRDLPSADPIFKLPTLYPLGIR